MTDEELEKIVHDKLDTCRKNGYDQLYVHDINVADHLIRHGDMEAHHHLDLIEPIRSWKRKRYN